MDEATPADAGAPVEGSSGEAVGVESGEVASAGGGSAPAAGDDARAGEEAVAAAPAEVPAAFRILNREFRDQKHAEEVLGSEVGAKRGLQRQNAELTKRLERMEAQIEDYQTRLRGDGSGGDGQKPGQGSNAKPESFAESLAQSGQLDFFNKLAQNPEIGVAGAIFEALKAQEEFQREHQGHQVEELRAEMQQTEARRSQEATMARAATAREKLREEFPELDDADPSASDEALEEREHIHKAILGFLHSTPQAIDPLSGQLTTTGLLELVQNPERAIRWAVTQFRQAHGTPVFAQPPGTSESPSARVADAAEKKAAASTADPLDGSGVPRQREGDKKPGSLADKWREGSKQLEGREATTPSGRRLGFSA